MADNHRENLPKRKRSKTDDGRFEWDNFDLDQEIEFDTDHKDIAPKEVPLPGLIFKLLVESTKDVEFLKKCRLFNKYWNEEACLRLHKYSITTLREGDANLDSFLNTLLDRSFEPSVLPCPFKNFHVVAYEFEDSVFVNLVRYPRIVTESLTLLVEGYFNAQQLDIFLNAKQDQVSKLTITSGFIKHVTRPIVNRTRFPALKTLLVKNDCFSGDGQFHYDEEGNDNCYHIDLLSTLQDSQLSSVDIKISSPDCFSALLELDLSKIKDFNLELNFNLGDNYWNALAGLKLPALKTMTFALTSGGPGHQQELDSFLGNVAAAIERLHINTVVDPEMNFVFPKLKYIRTPARSSTIFTQLLIPSKMPHLQAIHLTNATVDCMKFIENADETHFGVERFSISFVRDGWDNIVSTFPVWVTKLAKQFPNIDDFGMSVKVNWVPSFLRYINRALPQLSALRITGPIDLVTLAGVSKEEVDEYVRIDRISDITRRDSILDFHDLGSLFLEPVGPGISNDIVRYCLSPLSELGLHYLRFPWNASLGVDVVSNSLGRLQRVEISNSADWQDVMFELAIMLPASAPAQDWPTD